MRLLVSINIKMERQKIYCSFFFLKLYLYNNIYFYFVYSIHVVKNVIEKKVFKAMFKRN